MQIPCNFYGKIDVNFRLSSQTSGSARDNGYWSIFSYTVRKKNDLMFRKHFYACRTELNFRLPLWPRL